jgi:hypothetical protein
MSWHEERDKLLHSPINTLELRIEGSELEPLIEQLYRELDARGLQYKPPIYLSDEWGCPEGVPIIGVPFYLAHPQLARIELELGESLETPEESIMYLRHEAGHAYNYAYRFFGAEEWTAAFGPYSRPYVEDYKPNPFSRDYVRHIAGWYAQKHPDEDFAETFAVWLTPGSNWRDAYAGTPALSKLEYVDRLMNTIGAAPPLVRPERRDLPVEEMAYTVGDHYERRSEPRVAVPRWFDGDLKLLFDAAGEPAGSLIESKRSQITGEVSYWTGVQAGVIRSLVEHLLERVVALNLRYDPKDEQTYMISFTAMVTTLALNYLHHSSFAGEDR